MSAEAAAYLDSSAFVKLVAPEAESAALRDYLQTWPRSVSSALLRVEGLRAARKAGAAAFAAARLRLHGMGLMPIDDVVLNEAAAVGPHMLRSLDAIHLATAQQLGDDLGVLVTYDRRLAQAATELGLPVASPA
ncbi:MAG TPA: type II toxin-antitoxin system VapC family toxin [Chloroflexota bacterium]|nr:type II toxin-antitoxin system VapC family toxin [Chloroflexota bacterium]